MTPFLVEVEGIMRSIRILVVEDFEKFRRLICSALEQWAQFQVSEVSDGLEAVRRAKELKPDLVILDIGLPNLNGIEVARHILEFAPDARIIFLSQETAPDVVREALSLGVSSYVHKSRLRTDLPVAIEAALEDRRFVTSSLGVPPGAKAPAID
jgi:DNA-binding NarL/FixJ family response regulator